MFSPTLRLRLLPLAALLALLPALAPEALAQRVSFGSSDDPLEATLDPDRRGSGRVATYGGPSYVGVTWRLGLAAEAEGAVGPLAVGVEGIARGGPSGLYVPEYAEPYGALRAVRYARLNPTPRSPVYARVGPSQRVTLGSGLLVRDFASTADWSGRTVGAEAAAALPFIDLAAFTADVRMNDLVGGHVVVRPGGAPVGLGFRSLQLTLSAVHDLGIGAERAPSGGAAELHVDVYALGDFRLSPFIAGARYLHYGEGVAAGATFGSRELGGLGRLGLLAAVVASGEGFIPGYVNRFYPVSNPRARIVNSDAFFRDRATPAVAGTPLEDAPGGLSILLELDAAVFGTFELSPYIRRDYGGPNGAAGVRVTLAPDRGRDLRFRFELHRQGLDGFAGLFSDLVDEALLDFHVDYRVTGPVTAFLRSRYAYRRVGDAPDGTARYLVERRFEPMVGISLVR